MNISEKRGNPDCGIIGYIQSSGHMFRRILQLYLSAFAFIAIIVSCSFNAEDKNEKTAMSATAVPAENNKVRLSMITVDSTRLDEYNRFLKEEIEASMQLEPGVLALYAVSEKEHPNKVVILEIYADEDAYRMHIKTPHFIKYKEGTLDMVQSLELIDTSPLIPGLKIK